MNLINNKWLPIRRRNGTNEQIAPWQITENIQADPVETFNSPRADFNGALIQFYIGLLQTAFAPEDDYQWVELYENPPAPDILKESFLPFQHAFNADGDGPCFLQDYDLPDCEAKAIGSLLIEEPGENTVKKNTDHFIKRGNAEAMAMSTAIAALLTLQMNAPGGGKGNRVSIRGGGPMTTLLVPDSTDNPRHNTLWHHAWLNVLPKNEFEQLSGNPGLKDDSAVFPWLGSTRTSDKDGQDTTPEDGHPLQMYWGMPRRIRLDFSNTEQGSCSLTGENGLLVHQYYTKNYGVNYSGAWQHPLSPYMFTKQGEPLPLHPQLDGLGYRHWLGLTLGDKDKVITPAAVVHYHCFKSNTRSRIQTRLRVFGYDMDKMKARGWHETEVPIFHMSPQHKEMFTEMIRDTLQATTMVAGNLLKALKNTWFKPKAKIQDKQLSFITNSFWQNTEPDFYTLLAQLHGTATKGRDATILYHNWHKTLTKACMTLFNTYAASGSIEDEDPKRIALALRDLEKFNRKKGIRDALRLGIKVGEQ